MAINIDGLHDIAAEADRIAMHYFLRRTLKVESKADHSPVTQADLEIERMVRQTVKDRWPEVGVFGEEFGEESSVAVTRLIVDPIDGTRNFIRGIPFFATLLAVETHGEVGMGLISAAYTGERWWGTRGNGNHSAMYRSRWDEHLINVSTIEQLDAAQAFHGSLYGCEAALIPKTVSTLLAKTNRQRGVGDYYLHMLVASGAGEFGVDFGLKPWDKAALKAIVEGAGGRVTDLDGGFSLNADSIVSSNGLFHDEILGILNHSNQPQN